MNNDYSTEILKCLKNIGIFANSEDELSDLSEVIQDSLTFITFIVELEQMFGVEIPDEYLLIEKIASLDSINKMIEELKETKENAAVS
jgi:acyl carrier protein